MIMFSYVIVMMDQVSSIVLSELFGEFGLVSELGKQLFIRLGAWIELLSE